MSVRSSTTATSPPGAFDAVRGEALSDRAPRWPPGHRSVAELADRLLHRDDAENVMTRQVAGHGPQQAALPRCSRASRRRPDRVRDRDLRRHHRGGRADADGRPVTRAAEALSVLEAGACRAAAGVPVRDELLAAHVPTTDWVSAGCRARPGHSPRRGASADSLPACPREGTLGNTERRSVWPRTRTSFPLHYPGQHGRQARGSIRTRRSATVLSAPLSAAVRTARRADLISCRSRPPNGVALGSKPARSELRYKQLTLAASRPPKQLVICCAASATGHVRSPDWSGRR